MRSLDNDEGVAYGLVMLVIALAIGIFAWMFIGILIDALEVTFNSMLDMFSPTMPGTVTDTVDYFSYLPIFFLITGVVYIIVRSLRRDTDYS